MSYSDLLKDRRWQRKRLEVLNAADWKCESCDSSDDSQQLHVHHKRYVRGRKPWEYERDELQALCEKCHAVISETNALLDDAIGSVRMIGEPMLSMVLGYVEAIVECATLERNGFIKPRSYEHAEGIGRATGNTAERILKLGDIGEGVNVSWLETERKP